MGGVGPWMRIKECLEVHKEVEPSFSATLDVQRKEGLDLGAWEKGGALGPAANDSQGL